MTDGAGLPRHPYPVLLPDTGGFEEAIGRARARRRRQLFEATAMLGIAALFAGGFALSRPAPDNSSHIEFTDDRGGSTKGGGTVRDIHVPGVPSSTAPGGQTQPSSTGSGGSNSPGGTFSPKPVAPPDKAPVPPAPPAPKGYSVKYDPVRGTEPFGTECRTAATEQWCLYADVTPESANRYTLTAVVCRGIDVSDPALTFPTEQEVDFQVTLKGQVRWTWSYGQTFEGGERSLPVDAGECVKWDVRWDADDEEGRLLVPSAEAGDYTLRVRSTATQLGDRVATHDFAVE